MSGKTLNLITITLVRLIKFFATLSLCLKEIQIKIQIQIQPVLQAIEDASALHAKHKLLLDSYFLEKGSKPFIGETCDLSDAADNKYKEKTKNRGFQAFHR